MAGFFIYLLNEAVFLQFHQNLLLKFQGRILRELYLIQEFSESKSEVNNMCG